MKEWGKKDRFKTEIVKTGFQLRLSRIMVKILNDDEMTSCAQHREAAVCMGMTEKKREENGG